MNKENPPAFPRPVSKFPESRLMTCPPQEGMSLRDYIATAAMQAFVGNSQAMQAFGNGRDGDAARIVIAKSSYAIADAMLKERNEKHELPSKGIQKAAS